MFDSIEHIRAYQAALISARRLLCDEGKLIVTTLNAHSFVRPLLGRRWAWHQDPTHVHLFSRRSLYSAMSSAGFRHIRIETILNFCCAGESFPLLGPLRRIGTVVQIPWIGDTLLAVATR